MAASDITTNSRAGLPPGTLIHIGLKRRDTTTLRVIDYGPPFYVERVAESVEDTLAYRDQAAVTWAVTGAHPVTAISNASTTTAVQTP